MLRMMWQGASRTAQVQEMLRHAAGAWSTAWFDGFADGIAVHLLDGWEPADGVSGNWHITRPGGGTLWMRAAAALPQRLGALALGLPLDANHRLPSEVGSRCLAALIASLDAGASSASTAVEGIPAAPAAAFESRHGGVLVRLDGVPGKAVIAVDMAWCSTRATPLAHIPAPLPLAKRRSALAATRVKVNATIALGSLNLLDSLQLRVGEVLLTEVSSDPQVTLSTASGPVGSGRIGPDSAIRTIVLD